VPANSSRYFNSQDEAVKQPTAKIGINIDNEKNYFHNSNFDSSVIIYDNHYNTTNNSLVNISLNIFSELVKKFSLSNIIEIGCGRGEFVEGLHRINISAIGYDPTLKHSSSN